LPAGKFLKIAFVITEFWPLVGGLQKLPLRLGQELQRSGHEVRVITRFTQTRHNLAGYFQAMELTGNSETEGIPTTVLTVEGLRRLLLIPVFKLIWRAMTFPLARLLYVAAFRKVMMAAVKDCDCVHFFGVGVEMLGFSALDAARRARIPLFVEPALHASQWGEAGPDKLLYQKADRLIAHSKFEMKCLSKLGVSEERIDVIHHGVDLAVGGQAARFKTKYEIPGPLVLFLGRKTKDKGISLVLEAFSDVLLRFPTARLILAGPPGEALETLPEGVLDVGMLDEIEKNDALAACDLLCVPSQGESFGMVYFEAWAYGKPVVALDLPVLRETIGCSGGGILVEPKASAVSEAIVQLLADPCSAAKMGQAGFATASRHSWAMAAKSYKAIYER
jgi:glycosyltransferase involved in cell wall biosynthesis